MINMDPLKFLKITGHATIAECKPAYPFASTRIVRTATMLAAMNVRWKVEVNSLCVTHKQSNSWKRLHNRYIFCCCKFFGSLTLTITEYRLRSAGKGWSEGQELLERWERLPKFVFHNSIFPSVNANTSKTSSTYNLARIVAETTFWTQSL